MKFTKYIIAAAVMLAGYAQAVDEGFVTFATGGTAKGSGTNFVVIPSQSINGQPPVITFLSMRGSSASAITLQSYISTNQAVITLTNVIGLERTNYVSSTNGFIDGQILLIAHNGLRALAPRVQYEYVILTGSISTNQIVFATPPLSPIQVGDTINTETASASIAVANSVTASTTFNGSGILSGQRREPFLLILSSAGASTNTIDAINAVFPAAP